MRLIVCAVGRLRAGPERDIVSDYLTRTGRTGGPVGVGPATVQEVEDRARGGPSAEARLLLRAVPKGAAVCALDERGRALSSPEFAELIAGWRDAGRPAAAFLIGGAEGLDPEVRARADAVTAFGPMVWPHMLVRVMLSEQLYRATAILAGTPYHRG